MKKIKHILFALILISAFATLSACGGTESATDNSTDSASEVKKTTPITKEQQYFATGTPGGVYEILGTGMVNIVNQKQSDIELVAVSPAQLQQAPAMLQNKEAVIGIGMACMFERAYAGIDEFAGNPQADIVQVAGMYDNIYGLLVAADSPLNSIEDVTEKTVIASTATNLNTATQLITAAGTFDPAKIDYRVMSYAQAAEALGDGNADMIILTAFPYNGTLDSIASTKGVKFLKVSETTRAKFDELYPKNKMLAVPADTYKGQTEERFAPTIYTVLYANKNLSNDLISNVISIIIDNNSELAQVHPSGANFTLETTKRYIDEGIITIERMHPGAIEYFKDKDIIN